MTEITCPICRGGALARGEGRLDQSGETHLPTVVWSCGRCGYSRYEPARGKRWRPDEPIPVEQPVRAPAAKPRRAA